MLEMTNYNKYLERANKIALGSTFKRAIGSAILFFLILGFYGFAFYFGGYLRANDVKNGDTEYNGGSIIAIMFSVVFGAFGIGGAAPHVAAIAEGLVAGKLAYDVIDHKPKIDSTAKGIEVDQSKFVGEIKLNNVSFKYPTR
jgi:ATP-binding cassette subfamily B (MDR/TAP) protein 1